MSPIEIVAILAMTVYAIYKQTVVSEVKTGGRFKLAIIYGVVGVVVGGFMLPSGYSGWGLLAASLMLSALVGWIRGRRTDLWMEEDGRVLRRGNAVTIALFVGLIVAKFAIGTLAYFAHISDGAGFGEIMIMIAIMIAFQAEIVYRRGQALLTSVQRTPQTV